MSLSDGAPQSRSGHRVLCVCVCSVCFDRVGYVSEQSNLGLLDGRVSTPVAGDDATNMYESWFIIVGVDAMETGVLELRGKQMDGTGFSFFSIGPTVDGVRILTEQIKIILFILLEWEPEITCCGPSLVVRKK